MHPFGLTSDLFFSLDSPSLILSFCSWVSTRIPVLLGGWVSTRILMLLQVGVYPVPVLMGDWGTTWIPVLLVDSSPCIEAHPGPLAHPDADGVIGCLPGSQCFCRQLPQYSASSC